MTSANDRETTLLRTDDLYATFPEELAALARAGEARLTRELGERVHTQPMLRLELDEAVRRYRVAAFALLTAVTGPLAASANAETITEYVSQQVDALCEAERDNAESRMLAELDIASDTFTAKLKALARSAAWSRAR